MKIFILYGATCENTYFWMMQLVKILILDDATCKNT